MKTPDSKKIVAELIKIGADVLTIERACVAAYLAERTIKVPRRSFLRSYLSDVNSDIVDKVRGILRPLKGSLGLELLIELFELLVSNESRKKNGVAYTPHDVKNMMLQRILGDREFPSVFDPSCGCAAFLLAAAQKIHMKSGKTYSEIITKCIFGADIDAGAIEKTKALFALLLAENGEDGCAVPRLFNVDMLDKSSVELIANEFPNGFDCVVGNPPYVRFRNMDTETQRKVNAWAVSSCGNADLYMPFFEIGMALMAKSGVLGYITSNTYLQSLNGRCLRNWMSDSELSVEITDFRESQLFANVTCYTCVTLLRKRVNHIGISYRRATCPKRVAEKFTTYPFDAFERDAPWRMRSPEIDTVIGRLENSDRPLSDYVIRNGLATLANDVFFFHPRSENRRTLTREYDGLEWEIERAICRKVVKPNVIHNEAELQTEVEYAIFPYEERHGKFAVIGEDVLKDNYPGAYALLRHCKAKLCGRDKGKCDNYPAWYAYGRTQGMNCTGRKLLIPYIAGAPTAVLSEDRDLLFYCGYALINDDVDELRYLKLFLESDAFWYFIYHTSKPYSKGFMALAKNYITRFSIPNLDSASRRELMSSHDKEHVNCLIWKAYGLEPRNVFGQ